MIADFRKGGLRRSLGRRDREDALHAISKETFLRGPTHTAGVRPARAIVTAEWRNG